MSKFTTSFVSNPTVAQIDAAVSVCIKAYDRDIALQVMVGGNDSLIEPLFRAMLRCGVLDGKFIIATDDTGRIVGVSIWFGPGYSLFSTEEQRNLGFNDFLGRLPAENRQWWTTTYPETCDKWLERGDILGPTGLIDSWYASILAVDPQYHRQGVATRIIEHVYEQATKSDASAFLALCTQSNVNKTIYEHMGFTCQGHTVISDYAGQNEIVCFCLTRRPT